VWIVPRLCEKYTRSEWPCLYSSGYALEYIVPRLYQKYTCSEWVWLYASGYPLKCIAPLFPISTRNLHVSQNTPSRWHSHSAPAKLALDCFSGRGSGDLLDPPIFSPAKNLTGLRHSRNLTYSDYRRRRSEMTSTDSNNNTIQLFQNVNKLNQLTVHQEGGLTLKK